MSSSRYIRDLCRAKNKLNDLIAKQNSWRLESDQVDHLLANNVDKLICPLCESELTVEQAIKRIFSTYKETDLIKFKKDLEINIEKITPKINLIIEKINNIEKEYEMNFENIVDEEIKEYKRKLQSEKL